MKSINLLLSAVMIFFILSCDSGSEEFVPDEKLAVGEPTFSIDPNAALKSSFYLNIFRVAWTGEKLWALTAWEGTFSRPQALFEINHLNGEIIQTIPVEQFFSLDYANESLWDTYGRTDMEDQKFVNIYDASTGAYSGEWNYSGKYEMDYFLTFDGEKYWAMVNYNCDGYNCQTLVSYDLDGNFVEEREDLTLYYRYEDLVFGGEHFWASLGRDGIIFKLDKNFNVVRTYKITDYEKFGETPSANEIAMHLEYIDSNLWIIDRFNNFYKTDIE